MSRLTTQTFQLPHSLWKSEIKTILLLYRKCCLLLSISLCYLLNYLDFTNATYPTRHAPPSHWRDKPYRALMYTIDQTHLHGWHTSPSLTGAHDSPRLLIFTKVGRQISTNTIAWYNCWTPAMTTRNTGKLRNEPHHIISIQINSSISYALALAMWFHFASWLMLCLGEGYDSPWPPCHLSRLWAIILLLWLGLPTNIHLSMAFVVETYKAMDTPKTGLCNIVPSFEHFALQFWWLHDI